MNTMIQTVLLLALAMAGVAPSMAQPGEAGERRLIDPMTEPQRPAAPGSYVGELQSTHAHCATVARASGPAAANLTWTWEWLPADVPSGDERINASDACPCVWKIRTTRVEYSVEGEPLAC
jgi:hypothetical protein